MFNICYSYRCQSLQIPQAYLVLSPYLTLGYILSSPPNRVLIEDLSDEIHCSLLEPC